MSGPDSDDQRDPERRSDRATEVSRVAAEVRFVQRGRSFEQRGRERRRGATG